MIIKLLFLIFSFLEFSLYGKLLVITHSYNRPEFIEIQHKTFKKFLKDEYVFIIFNDARDVKMWETINNTCKKLKIRCVSIPQKIHTRGYLPLPEDADFNAPSYRTANVIQFSLDKLAFMWKDQVMIIDSDMFLIKPFSVQEYMQNAAIAGVPQTRGNIDYLWNGLVFFDMPKLPNKQDLNFNCGLVEGHRVDTGGYMYHYLKKNPQVAVKYINHVFFNFRSEDKQIASKELQAKYQSFFDSKCVACGTKTLKCSHMLTLFEKNCFNQETIDFIKSDVNDVEFLCDGSFFHYRSGANWNGKSAEYHMNKSRKVNTFIARSLASSI